MDDMSPSAAALAAERDAYLRQRDEALGERNELRRQLDIALGERNELRRQLDIAIGEANLSAEFCDHYAHRAEMTAPPGRSHPAVPASRQDRRHDAGRYPRPQFPAGRVSAGES
jgi:hypothetical protein